MSMDINAVLTDENMLSAIEFLKTKKNTCGDDGIWLHDLEEYWSLNKDALRVHIKNGLYCPQLIHEKVITMSNGKHRYISLFSSVDRMILRAILSVIQIPLERGFSKYSFAYQTGKGVNCAVKCSAEYVQKGYEYVLEMDVKVFFDTVDHKIILDNLKNKILDKGLYKLLEKYISCKIERDCHLYQKTYGLSQGNPLSPLLSNIYLSGLDQWMENRGYHFVRFADDINIYVSDLQEGYAVLAEVEQKIKEYKLEINQDKKGVFSVYARTYLGYQFEKSGNSVLVKRKNCRKRSIYSNWNKHAIEKIGHDYYIINDGILTKKDFTILFMNEEQKNFIPIETTDALNIYSNIEITPNFLDFLNNKSLNLNIFNAYGMYIGSFYVANQKNCMNSLIKQVEIYQSKEIIEYAKKIETASLYNLKSNLCYYKKHHPL